MKAKHSGHRNVTVRLLDDRHYQTARMTPLRITMSNGSLDWRNSPSLTDGPARRVGDTSRGDRKCDAVGHSLKSLPRVRVGQRAVSQDREALRGTLHANRSMSGGREGGTNETSNSS